MTLRAKAHQILKNQHAIASASEIVVAEPGKCYLDGATGPLDGATVLRGNRPIEQLERLAADFAKRLGVSPIAVEDALCNWQK